MYLKTLLPLLMLLSSATAAATAAAAAAASKRNAEVTGDKPVEARQLLGGLLGGGAKTGKKTAKKAGLTGTPLDIFTDPITNNIPRAADVLAATSDNDEKEEDDE